MIRLRTLGVVSLRTADGTEQFGVLAHPRQFGLLAYFAVAGLDGYVQRETLLGMFWPDSDDQHARASLRQVLHGLRHELGPDIITAHGDNHLLFNSQRVWCDVTEFEAAIRQRDHLAAVELYSGPFLRSFYVRSAPEFERWVQSKRHRLERRYEMALEDLAAAAESAGDLRNAVDWWDRLVEQDRCKARYVLRLMQALAKYGDRAGALEVSEGYERAIRDDLDMDPHPAVLAYRQQLRAGSHLKEA